MEILEYIYKHSLFCKDADLLIKITGRLILLNIVSLVKRLDGQKHEFVSAYLYGRATFQTAASYFFSILFPSSVGTEREHQGLEAQF